MNNAIIFIQNEQEKQLSKAPYLGGNLILHAVNEIRKLSDVYCRYKNIGAFNVNCTKETLYLEMTDQIAFPIIKSICGITPNGEPSPLLVGCFEATEGLGKAFTVVNMRELVTHYSADVEFSLNGYDNAVVYIKGEPVEMTADNGIFRLHLECGEGAFVTVG